MFKILMFWNIRPGRGDEYFEFILQEFGPTLVKLGIQPIDAWYTYYGEGPQILTSGVAEDLETVKRVLSSEEWKKLKMKLLSYVTDYEQKVVRAEGGFQL